MSNKLNVKKKVLVIGGSLGGLFAANMMKQLGWTVDVFERSEKSLDSRGGGIVLQHEVVELIEQVGIKKDWHELGVASKNRVVFDKNQNITYKQHAPQIQTSWSLIYSLMKENIDAENYHQGKKLINVKQVDNKVLAYFDDGTVEDGDLLIGADGNNSTVRQLLWPEEKPTYAGYIAWRGLIDETLFPEVAEPTLHSDFAFASNKESHILGYLVPGDHNDLRPGYRLYNWVWYRVVDEKILSDITTDIDGISRGLSVPEGKLAPHWKEAVYREANSLLPKNFAAVVNAAKNPFAQAIRDLAVSSMVKGRVILVGDAAAIPRPHTAASTSKAATNALALQQAFLKFPYDVDQALKFWEPSQVRLGQDLKRMGMRIGNRLMFSDSGEI